MKKLLAVVALVILIIVCVTLVARRPLVSVQQADISGSPGSIEPSKIGSGGLSQQRNSLSSAPPQNKPTVPVPTAPQAPRPFRLGNISGNLSQLAVDAQLSADAQKIIETETATLIDKVAQYEASIAAVSRSETSITLQIPLYPEHGDVLAKQFLDSIRNKLLGINMPSSQVEKFFGIVRDARVLTGIGRFHQEFFVRSPHDGFVEILHTEVVPGGGMASTRSISYPSDNPRAYAALHEKAFSFP